MKETVDKIIDTYGEFVTLRKFTETTNEYGELLDTTYTDVQVKIIFGGSLDDKLSRELFGQDKSLVSSLIVGTDVSVEDTDKFIIDGKPVDIKEIRTIKYKGQSVVQLVLI